MRFASFVLSLYLFALALLPCGDSADHEHAHGDNPKIAITQTENGHTNHHADMCSPFCLCQCCHTSVVELGVPFVPDGLAALKPLNSNYNRNFQNGFPQGVLHPPRA